MGDSKEERAIRFRQEVEASPSFKAVATEMARAARTHRESLQQKMENNAEYQRRKRMSPEEKARGAIDRMAGSIQTFTEQTTGKRLTHEQAMSEARRIAKKALGQDV